MAKVTDDQILLTNLALGRLVNSNGTLSSIRDVTGAAAGPTGADDVTQGFAPGSLWTTSLGHIYMATSTAQGAAEWQQLFPAVASGGILPVGGGGTGADNATAARTNLGAASAATLAAHINAENPHSTRLFMNGGAFPYGQPSDVRGALDVPSNADLSSSLSGKSNVGHSHAISEVPGLQAALDAKSGEGGYMSRTHSNVTGFTSGAITWGTLVGSSGSAVEYFSGEFMRLVQIGNYRVTVTLPGLSSASGTAGAWSIVLYTRPLGGGSNTDIAQSKMYYTATVNSYVTFQTHATVTIAPGQAREVAVWIERVSGSLTMQLPAIGLFTVEAQNVR